MTLTSIDPPKQWDEEDSSVFLELSDIITPHRREQIDLMASLVPAEPNETFSVVDLGCGAGDLSRALLNQFQRCFVLALDSSATMRAAAAERLGGYADRVRLDSFDLHRRDWLARFPHDVRCVVSSLAIHHLDGEEKQRLFWDLADRLPIGGALLIADLVEPVNSRAVKAYGDSWDRIVAQQSLALTGSSAAYNRFRDGWNHYRDPDPEVDTPSGLFEQLRWLADAQFSLVDCFWLQAGHAVYGGFK